MVIMDKQDRGLTAAVALQYRGVHSSLVLAVEQWATQQVWTRAPNWAEVPDDYITVMVLSQADSDKTPPVRTSYMVIPITWVRHITAPAPPVVRGIAEGGIT